MAAWFPCQHPEQVRIAQFAASVQQLRSDLVFIISMMLLGLAAQVRYGSPLAALAWQFAMGTLAYVSFATWRRLRESPPEEELSARHIHGVTVAAALCGACWASGLVAWMSGADPQLALIAIGVSITCTAHCLAARYFVPWAAVAFSVPLIAGSIFVCVSTLDAPMAQVGIILIALYALAGFSQLRRNWARFAGSADGHTVGSQLEAMLMEQKEIAERAVQLKTRFLASASHDLRQPMHAISLYLDGLAEITDLPERIRRVVADAQVCAHDMNDMFRSLLDMSRLDAQQAVPALSVFCIGSVLSRVEKEFLPLATSRGIQLTVRPCADHV